MRNTRSWRILSVDRAYSSACPNRRTARACSWQIAWSLCPTGTAGRQPLAVSMPPCRSNSLVTGTSPGKRSPPRLRSARCAAPPASHSSASSSRFQSAADCSSAALRAAAKSSHQSKRLTSAPAACASKTVSSADPVSSTSIASTNGAALSRQRVIPAAWRVRLPPVPADSVSSLIPRVRVVHVACPPGHCRAGGRAGHRKGSDHGPAPCGVRPGRRLVPRLRRAGVSAPSGG